MAFGLRNAPATCQHVMQLVLKDVSQCNVYLDDVVIYSSPWTEHMARYRACYMLQTVFSRFSAASLILNLKKCEFAKATVTYLGKQVGSGKVLPIYATVTAILSYPIPVTRQE